MPAGWFPLVVAVAGSSVVLVKLERSVELGFSQGQTQSDENAALGKRHLPISTPAPPGLEETPEETDTPVLSSRFNVGCAHSWDKAAEFHLVLWVWWTLSRRQRSTVRLPDHRRH